MRRGIRAVAVSAALIAGVAACTDDAQTQAIELSDGHTVDVNPAEPLPDEVIADVLAAAPYGAYEAGDTIEPLELPTDLRRDAAENIAGQIGRDLVWVTDGYSLQQGGVVHEVHLVADGTGDVRDRLQEDWRSFDDPDEALAYAEEAVAETSAPENYDIIPYQGLR